ncbi:hypothetical protein [Gluconobacter frateurii]|uniref:hypothetical protein n=1 Tax=Gluconobacter frateurii TaxID=38308 RepID=UPI000C07AB3D|nr:hypothetical protein [Gluconobacter frateurii]
MPLFSVDIFTKDRHHRLDFHVCGESDIVAFFGIFGTVQDGKINTEAVQRATPVLKTAIANFCAERRAHAPQLGAFIKLIGGLADDEGFVVVPAREWTSAQISVFEMLVGWSNGTVKEEDITKHEQLFGGLLSKYNCCVARTDRRTQVGNAQIERRTCRFCRRSRADGAKFVKQAHAISRALGNIHLTLADECDDCNEFFGNELEPHLLEFLKIQRAFLGITGRAGNLRIESHGGTILNDGEKMVVAVPREKLRNEDGVVTIDLAGDLPIIPERCYRTLAKFVLSIIPEDNLVHLTRTIDWVRNGVVPSPVRALLPVQAAIVPLPPNSSAQLTVYIRKDEKSPLPHIVGEFRLGCFLFVFHLPFSDRDVKEPDFIGSPVFDDVFQHYGNVGSWRPYAFDSREPFQGPMVIRLIPNPNSPPAADSPSA